MNKIRKYLIHLLGGVTKELCEREATLANKNERVMGLCTIKWIMEACYGMQADEWCKNVYEYTCERLKYAERDLHDYMQKDSTSGKPTKKKV